MTPALFRPLRLVNLALALAAGAGLFLTPSTAQAAVALGADLEADIPLDLDDVSTAPAFALRLGWQLHLPLIVLVPEVGYHHASFGNDVTLNRGFAGVRIGIGEVFRVGAFGHVGVGHATFHYTTVDATVTDATYDVGGYLDFTLLPLLDVGVHAGYGRVKAGDDVDALEWVPLGAHATLIF